MAFEISFRESHTQLWVVFSGTVTIDEIRDSWSRRIADEALFRMVRFMVADYSGADMRLLGTSDAENGAAFPQEALRINPNVTLISILPTNLEFGRARQWATYTEMKHRSDLPWEMVFVRTRAECMEELSSRMSPTVKRP